MDDADRIDEFDLQIEAIGRSLGYAREQAQGVEGDVLGVRRQLNLTDLELQGLNRGISAGLKRSFEDLLFDGERLSDVLRDLGNTISRSIYRSAVNPVFNQVGGLLSDGIENFVGGLLPFAKGAPFSQGRVVPFATGGIVTGPVSFPLRGGTGLMGEAGPEAILPLSRTADGRLGVAAQGSARGANVTINVTTPDVAGFERSQAQIAAQMSRALSRGQRNR
ncbi:MAG: phage tail tape measure protein [Pseudomonadota bacterium]